MNYYRIIRWCASTAASTAIGFGAASCAHSYSRVSETPEEMYVNAPARMASVAIGFSAGGLALAVATMWEAEMEQRRKKEELAREAKH